MCVDVFMSVRVTMYRLSHSNIDITIAIGIHELLFLCVCVKYTIGHGTNRNIFLLFLLRFQNSIVR